MVALDFFTADIAKIGKLFLRLHTFCQRVDVNDLGHLYNGGHDAFGAQIERPQKAHVQLQLVKAKFLEDIQRRIGAAEVVHPYLITCGTEPVHDPHHEILLLRHDALGDFKIDEVVRNLVITYNMIRDGKNITECKIEPRQIDGHRYRSFPVCDGTADPCADLPEDPGIKQMDQPLPFQHRDELIRIDHAQLRIVPARKRLKAAQLSCGRADDRLIEGLDLVIVYRLFVVFDNECFKISSHGTFSFIPVRQSVYLSVYL